MQYEPGQELLGRIRFKDGAVPEYDRPYLTVDVSANTIGILNVSSTKDKEVKALFKSNHPLCKFSPPFVKPSFVKLDSYVKITSQEADKMILLSRGQTLNEAEMNDILTKMELYKEK